jgi:hypothetical protein
MPRTTPPSSPLAAIPNTFAAVSWIEPPSVRSTFDDFRNPGNAGSVERISRLSKGRIERPRELNL